MIDPQRIRKDSMTVMKTDHTTNITVTTQQVIVMEHLLLVNASFNPYVSLCQVHFSDGEAKVVKRLRDLAKVS